MPDPVLTNDFRRVVTDALRTGGTPLLDVVHGLASNAINPTPTTKLADLTPCVFTGYAPVRGNSPSVAYIDTDGKCKALYPNNLFMGTDGAAQRMSTTVRGPVTMAGNASMVVTAAGMPGSPRTVTAAVLTTDTDEELAEKCEEALRADADVGPFFDVTSSGDTLTLTRIAPAANDATMEISVADGTSVGIVTEATASQDRPGAAAGGAFTAGVANIQYATDAAGTMLLWAQRITSATIAVPGQGVDTALVYVHGA